MDEDSLKVEEIFVKGFIILQIIVFACFSGALCNFVMSQYIYATIVFMAFLLFSDETTRYQTLLLVIYVGSITFFHFVLGEHSTRMIPYLCMLLSTFLFFAQAFKKGYDKFIINCFMITALLLAGYGITEYIVGKNYLFINFFRVVYQKSSYVLAESNKYQVTLGFEHPLIAAICLSILSVTLLNLKKKWLLCLSIGLSILACFFTGKRTGSLLLILAIGLYYLLKWILLDGKRVQISKKAVLKCFLAVILILILVCIPVNGTSLVGATIERFKDLLGKDNMSLVHRGTSIYKGIKLFLQSNSFSLLLGHGMYSLTNYFIIRGLPITVEGFYAIDNTYVCFLYDFGLVTTIFMLYFHYKILHNAIIDIKKNKNNQDLVMLVGYITLLSISFIFDALYWYTTIFLLAVFCAYFFAKYEKEVEECQETI